MGARYPYQGVTKDGGGRVICSATVAVFLTGTTTPASIYTASAGGVAVNSVTSGADTSSAPGYFIFYIDRDNYSADQEFDITISKSGFNNQTYSFIKIDNAADYPLLAGRAAGQTLYLTDLITEGPWVDVRSFMDGQSGRPTYAEWNADQATTDVTAVILAAIYSVLDNGGNIVFPTGYYRVTQTVNIGLPEYDEYDFIVSRTTELSDDDYLNHQISANITSNFSKSGVTLIFNENAFIVADFSPNEPTPVIAYNLRGAYRKEGQIINPAVISSAMISNGKYYFDAVKQPQSNNLIGIYYASGCKILSKPFVSGCEYGIVSAKSYWTRLTDVRVEWAGGDCLNISSGNALKAGNVVFWHSNRGLVFDGAASKIGEIHTENVAEDITIFLADCCEFGPAYLEDTSITDGTGLYAVRLGYIENGVKIMHSGFNGIRVGSARPNKGRFRLWDCGHTVLKNCRAYSGVVTTDTSSIGTLIDCDFWLKTTKWNNIKGSAIIPGQYGNETDEGYLRQIFHLNHTSIGGPYNGIAPGEGQHVDITVTGVKANAKNTVIVSPTSGISTSFMFHARVVSDDTVRIIFRNVSNSDDDLGGNVAITVLEGT